MGLNSVVNTFKTDTYQVSRVASGAYVDGVLQPATPTTFPIDASIVPLASKLSGGNVLDSDAVGQRQVAVKTAYTVTELFTRNSGFAADVITINSEPFTVISVQFWEGKPEDSMYECKLSRQAIP